MGKVEEVKEPNRFPWITTIILVGIVGIIALFGLGMFTMTVPAGSEGVVFDSLQGGVQQGVRHEGLQMKLPWQYIQVFDMRTQKYTANASAASKDLQVVQANVALNYHLMHDTSESVYKNIGIEYEERIIHPAVQESVKAVTAKYNAEELIVDRELVKQQIQDLLATRLAGYNIVVEQISITNFDFSVEFNAAIEAKQVAAQNALQAQYKLQQVQVEQQQKVATAQAEAQAKILQAEGDANSTILRGTANANVTRITGDAEAYAIMVKRQQIDSAIISYKQVETWNGQLPTVMSGVVPFLNLGTNVTG